MVYEHCFETEYKRLPLSDCYKLPNNSKHEIGAIYWWSFTVPTGLMATNRQLDGKIRAMLPKMRTDDTPDVVCQYPSYSASWDLPLFLTYNTISLTNNNELPAIVETRQKWAVGQGLHMALHRQLGIASSAYDTCKKCEPLIQQVDVDFVREFAMKTMLRVRQSGCHALRI
jgi:hypothetical protein